MIDIILGAIALLVFLIALREFLGADPKMLARNLRYFALGSLLLTALGLVITERIIPAVAVAILAFVLFARRPFWFFRSPRNPASGRSGKASSQAGASARGTRPDSGMSRNEAYAMLGLQPGADEHMIITAHRELIMKNHPDLGGSSEVAARINEAKDVLLRA